MNFEVISDCQEKHLKTFVRELQIVQHLENQLVKHYIYYESCTYLLVVYRLMLSLSKFPCNAYACVVCNFNQKKHNNPKMIFLYGPLSVSKNPKVCLLSCFISHAFIWGKLFSSRCQHVHLHINNDNFI